MENEVGNGNEFIVVEKSSFLQWVNSITRCECGAMMSTTIKSEIGMVKTFEAKCELCSEETTWCTSPGGGMQRYEVHRRAVEAGLHCGVLYGNEYANDSSQNLQQTSEGYNR